MVYAAGQGSSQLVCEWPRSPRGPDGEHFRLHGPWRLSTPHRQGRCRRSQGQHMSGAWPEPSELDSQKQAIVLAQGVRKVSLCLPSQPLRPLRGSGGPAAILELGPGPRSPGARKGSQRAQRDASAGPSPADRHLLRFSSVPKLKPENMKGVKILQYKYISCYNTLNLRNFELPFW